MGLDARQVKDRQRSSEAYGASSLIRRRHGVPGSSIPAQNSIIQASFSCETIFSSPIQRFGRRKRRYHFVMQCTARPVHGSGLKSDPSGAGLCLRSGGRMPRHGLCGRRRATGKDSQARIRSLVDSKDRRIILYGARRSRRCAVSAGTRYVCFQITGVTNHENRI